MNTLQPFLTNRFAKFFNGGNRPNHLAKIFFKLLTILQPAALFDATKYGHPQLKKWLSVVRT